ncbi:MAG: glycosyltransferase family 1 protein [Cyclobacteriaceae bacterium]|nr:glycosyltransferase family 1 protein [Cyclobacteriaceae bacterium HetDA_MAG_MS6]
MGKLRIAFFLDVMKENFDGVSITMHEIIRRIPEDRVEPIFITPQPPESPIGYPVYECPYLDIPFSNKDYRFAVPKRMKNLKSILRKFDPHLIHFSSPSALGGFAVDYGDEHNIPVTTIYHTHFPSFATYYLKYIPQVEKISNVFFKDFYSIYHKCQRIFAPTKPMKEYLLNQQVPESIIKMWGRGVSMIRFNPERRDEQFWPQIPEGDKKVLFVSRLVKEKEPDTLIRLYRLFNRKRPHIKMVITGDGPTREKLEKNMPDALFTGKLTGNDLAKAYASADVFVFPSTTETFGNVVLEAMASGLPVVAANAGGPSDIIKHEISGLLVEPQKERAFYKNIIRLIDDESYYQKIRSGGLEYAKSQSWAHLCDLLFSEYEQLASRVT